MDLVERLLWLAGIPSHFAEEKAIADEIEAVMRGLALPEEPRRYGNSLVAPLVAKAGAPSIVLVGNLDVSLKVPLVAPRIEEGRLHGAGVADMKSGLALMMDLAERPPKGVNLTAVFHARGEGGFHENDLNRAILPVDAAVKGAELAVVLKPTDNSLQLGCAGSTHATFVFSGKRGLSGQPSQRRNAIHAAQHVLSTLARTEPIPDVVNGLTFYEYINATSAEGGGPGRVVPEEFLMNLHHVYGPSLDPHDSQDRLINFAYGSAMLRFEDLSPPAAPVRDYPLIRKLEQSGVREVGPRLTWTDVACFTEMGIPAVNFGPGTEAQAYQRDEWTDVAALAEGRAILERWFTAVGSSSAKAKPKARASAVAAGKPPGGPRKATKAPAPAKGERAKASAKGARTGQAAPAKSKKR